MAHYEPMVGMENYTGAVSKKKIQGVNQMTVTRRKHIKDPITGEVVGKGPKEIYVQSKRDYKYHPMTAGEQTQRSKWTEACRMASQIIKNQSHPHFMEMYNRWKEHLNGPEPHKQFPNFVRSVLAAE